MTRTLSLQDLDDLCEGADVEFKLAAGADGAGAVPKDFWPTYSAFANSGGGIVVLGIRETKSVEGETRFTVEGLSNPERVKTDLFNTLNNPQKVSVAIIGDGEVETVTVDGNMVLKITIPAATRQQKPVYINNNPMTGTYRRLHEGDRLCDAERVQRMLAEKTEDSRDNRVLKGFDLSDIDLESLSAYRHLLRAGQPDHPFLLQDDQGFLRQLKGWGRDRESGNEGLTLAGLLMFGRAVSIRDELPNYFLDYQEQDSEQPDQRWSDRVTSDEGTWSGNLFDFYRKVYRKLVADIKVPFVLHDGQRQDETAVHVALREALINTLVHADYSDRASVLVIKRPNSFLFRNPGKLRIPAWLAWEGGHSDGRNRTLQTIFSLIGLVERAGSGMPKIMNGWFQHRWQLPRLWDTEEPSDQTCLALLMVDFLPPEIVEELRTLFGDRLDSLDTKTQVVLALALRESSVSHARLKEFLGGHPHDLSKRLQALCQDGFLIKSGQSRGATYHLAGLTVPGPEDVFGQVSPQHPGFLHPDLLHPDLTLHPDLLHPDLTLHPDLLHPDLPDQQAVTAETPVINGLQAFRDVHSLPPPLREELETLAAPVASKKRASPDALQAAVLSLCSGRYLTLPLIVTLLCREQDHVRKNIVTPLVNSHMLTMAFPHTPNDPRQAYTTTPNSPPEA